jgi:hypothetical protein
MVIAASRVAASGTKPALLEGVPSDGPYGADLHPDEMFVKPVAELTHPRSTRQS